MLRCSELAPFLRPLPESFSPLMDHSHRRELPSKAGEGTRTLDICLGNRPPKQAFFSDFPLVFDILAVPNGIASIKTFMRFYR
jgi:hypothetical protein